LKLPAGKVEAFLQRPDAAVATVLLYGSDAGLVSERALRLAKSIVEELDDPFRVSELSADELRTSPGRLVEEAQALCLLGGRRLVRVRDAVDAIGPAVRDLLALPAQEGFVLLEAGELASGSSLRRAIEQSPSAMALPCFLPSERDLGEQVRVHLAEHGLDATPDAFAHLVASLGRDRALTRVEIEKLALYLADAPQARVTLADAAAVVGDSSALSLDDAVRAALLGEQAALDAALDRLLAEGEAPVRLLRTVASFLLRLLRLRADIAGGVPLEAAIKAARPPIHFSLEPLVRTALGRWHGEALIEGVAILQAAEIRCKSTGMPEALICRAALGQLGRLVPSLGPSGRDRVPARPKPADPPGFRR
jgi:DNA polymerase-3 subunit delta